MIIELLLKPITSSKKLLNSIQKNLLIGLSFAVPILIALIPAFVINRIVASILKPLMSLGSLFGSSVNNELSNVSDGINSIIFKYIFGRILLINIIIIVVLLGVLVIYNNLRKSQITAKYIWTSMVIAGIQIVYYFIIGGLLSFLSYYFAIICIVGIINSIICLHAQLSSFGVIQEVGQANSEVAASSVSNIDLSTNILTDELDVIPIIAEDSTYVQDFNTNPITNTNENKEFTPEQKKMFAIIAGVVVVVVGLIFIGNKLTSKEYVAEKLIEAIKNNDAKAASKYVIASDPRLEMNEKNVSAYIKYLKDNPSVASEVISEIESQSKTESSTTNISSTFSSIISGNDIKLTTSGKKFGFFTNNVYQLPVYFMEIKTQYNNMEVSVNGEKVYTTNSESQTKECGPYLPGNYKVSAKVKSDYAEATGEKDVVLSNLSSLTNKADVQLDLKGKELDVLSDWNYYYSVSNYKAAKIIVNGKNTGITVENEKKLIPLKDDGSVKIQLENEFPWGTEKTNEVIVGKDDMEFSFGKSNTGLLDKVKPSVTEFIKSYGEAYKALDISKVTNATDSFKQYIYLPSNTYVKHNITGSISSIKVDPAKTELEYDSSDKAYTITLVCSINTDLKMDNYNVFDNYNYKIKLQYDSTQKKWLGDSISSTYSSDSIQNPIEIKIN